MELTDLDKFSFQTPAFICHEDQIIQSLTPLNQLRKETGCKVLFSIKALSVVDALEVLAEQVDGFATSSLFEAKLSHQVLKKGGTVHLTTPGLREQEIDEIAQCCHYLSFNSISQWHRFHKAVSKKLKWGLRINTQLSYVADDRYNPCRKHSKLGVPLDFLVSTLNENRNLSDNLSGIHFHTNCESSSAIPFHETVEHLRKSLRDLLPRIQWINLGGGYQYDKINNLNPLMETIYQLKKDFDLDVFIEPGEAIAGRAGYIVSSVIDLIESDGKKVAILDTTVNHMPEVFEYQDHPKILNQSKEGTYSYLLAGCTCLAGDQFGEYQLSEPLKIGSKIVFSGMGAYSFVKAHMFNGVNLPTLYSLTQEGKLIKRKEFSYEDFLSRNGG